MCPKFKALVLYIEHRFYGESTPLENIDIALEDIKIRGCFTSAQVLMKYKEEISAQKFPNYYPWLFLFKM
ncbi:Prolyl carboxy peptidase like protein 5 [Bienertia sinuspersici]